MKKLSEGELKRRAKLLYFDKNKSIKSIFVDEFGRFSYDKQTLLEVNKKKDVKIFEINSAALAKEKFDSPKK